MKKRILALFIAALFLVCAVPVCAQNESIVILYENDVHCAIEGYAKIAAMKNELAATADHVGVVSMGDYVQGSSLGAVSQGDYIVDLMNLVGYDAVALGNHEFDYRLPRLQELANKMNTKPVCANFQKIGETDTVFDPYTIVTYGSVKIAYVGVTTPDTLVSSSPAQFKDADDNYIYTFNGDNLYATVQRSIDAAKNDGADYVIALAHLGTESVYEQWSAQTLIKNTVGIDVLLDGHSHSVVPSLTVADKNGDDVLVSSTGTKFANIGKLTLANGTFTTELISTEGYDKTDDAVTARIAEINDEYAQLGDRKIGESKVTLTTVDENGNRLVRHTETNLGDFCADAFRLVTGADIGFINGGGLRADMAAGDVTFNDILSVFPFNNQVVVIEATGQQIVDMLELGVLNYPNEDGSFQHVSGITFELDGSIPSPVKLDSNMAFVKVDGTRRVRNVKVLGADGTYAPIDLAKTYTLASHNYLLLEQGGGATMFKNATVVKNDGMLDVELLEVYITDHLGGVIDEQYAASQGRIRLVTVEDEKKDDEDEENVPTVPPTDDNDTENDAPSSTDEDVPSIPQTGVETHTVVWLVLGGVSLAGLALVVATRKRKEE